MRLKFIITARRSKRGRCLHGALRHTAPRQRLGSEVAGHSAQRQTANRCHPPAAPYIAG